jgi:hypothetical protein
LKTAAPTGASTTASPASLTEQAKAYILQASPGSTNALSDTSSPQYQAMEWLSSDPYFSQRSNPKSLFRWALVTLYYSTDGSQWTNSAGWLSGSDECTWFTSNTATLNCNGAGFFADLELNENNLHGTIPSELSLLSDNLGKSFFF